MIPYYEMTPKMLRERYHELHVALKVAQAKLRTLMGMPLDTDTITDSDLVYQAAGLAYAHQDEVAYLLKNIADYSRWLIEIADLLIGYANA